jgi:tetratricopeptide (TPR) repeat protein
MAAVGNQRPFQFGAWRVDPARGVLFGETRERRYIETVPKRGYRAVIDEPSEGPNAPRPAAPAPPAEAAALIEQGRRALATPLPQSLTQALLFFQEAVRKAPGYAPAHQGLADALIVRHFAGGAPALEAAKAAARAAVGLDEGSAGAWSTLGMALLLADRDFAAADAALQRAVALDPAATAPHRHRAFALATVGRFVEAEREARRTVELAPASLEARGELLQLLLAARRYRHAAAEASAVLAIAPAASEAWYARGWALVLAGDLAEGTDALLKGFELWGAEPQRLDRLRETFRSEGMQAVARAGADIFLQQQILLPRRLMDVAMLRAAGGQPDAAFEALEAALAKDDYVLLLFPWLPYFDPLKADPRYETFVRRLRLVR